MSNNETKQQQVNSSSNLGVFILIAGLFLLFNKFHFFFIPHFVFSWSLIFVLMGLVLGLRDGFKNNSWKIVMLIGGCFFIMRNHFFGMHLLLLPVILIVVGLIILLSHRKNDESMKSNQYTTITEVKQIK